LIIAIISAVIGSFMLVRQYQLALYALAFIAGALTGAGGIKAFERTRAT
jgi:hypothetical protein